MTSLESFSERINVGKRYPGYFNQWIFRPLVAIMIGLFVFALWSNDWRWSGSYTTCPVGGNQCFNALYEEGCLAGSCSVMYLQPGESVGEKPSSLANNIGFWEFFLVAIAFMLNHWYYIWGIR